MRKIFRILIISCYFYLTIAACHGQEKSSSPNKVEPSPEISNIQTNDLQEKQANKTCDFSEYNTLYQKPDALVMVRPAYPKKAKKKKIRGEVKVRVLIDKTGNVIKACAVEGNELLRESAVKAALLWKCSPPVKELERAGREYLEYIITFNFQP